MKILSRIPLVGSWFGKNFAAEDAASAPAADKPAKSKTLEEIRQTRRRIVWACIGTYLGANFVMFLRFFFPRTLFEPKTEFSIGYPGDFAPGVTTKFQKQRRIWVVRVPGRLFVVYAKCTHLGCTPDWKESENKFKCPCHGSGYDSEGNNFEGPAPRPLDRALVSLNPEGKIVVNTSVLFEKPPGGTDEFNDDGAYLTI